MYCLEAIIEMNRLPRPVIRGNDNRDCSCNFTKSGMSGAGVICHSASQRSTFFASATEHAETYHLIQCVKGNQIALNAAVEALALGYSVPSAWRTVILVYHGPRIPGLKIRGGDKVKHARVDITVEIPCKGGVDVLTFGEFWQAFNALAAIRKGGVK